MGLRRETIPFVRGPKPSERLREKISQEKKPSELEQKLIHLIEERDIKFCVELCHDRRGNDPLIFLVKPPVTYYRWDAKSDGFLLFNRELTPKQREIEVEFEVINSGTQPSKYHFTMIDRKEYQRTARNFTNVYNKETDKLIRYTTHLKWADRSGQKSTSIIVQPGCTGKFSWRLIFVLPRLYGFEENPDWAGYDCYHWLPPFLFRVNNERTNHTLENYALVMIKSNKTQDNHKSKS